MSNNNGDDKHQLARQSREFRRVVLGSATQLLTDWVGEERAREAVGRIASAFSASALAARDATDFYACVPASVALCVATAALTGIMPSTGAAALAYLIPRRPRRGEDPHLNYQLSHRGLAALAKRAGMFLVPIPVGHDDKIEMEDGEVSRLVLDIDNPPMVWDDLRGVVVIVKDLRTATVLFRGWMPLKLIAKRREMSDSFKWADGTDWKERKSTWHAWPSEMASKTAMHYAISRGWAVIDDTEAVRALSVDGAGDIVDASFSRQTTDETTTRPTGRAAIGLGGNADAPQLTDGQEGRDLEEADAEAGQRHREARVRVERNPPAPSESSGQPEPPPYGDDEAPE